MPYHPFRPVNTGHAGRRGAPVQCPYSESPRFVPPKTASALALWPLGQHSLPDAHSERSLSTEASTRFSLAPRAGTWLSHMLSPYGARARRGI